MCHGPLQKHIYSFLFMIVLFVVGLFVTDEFFFLLKRQIASTHHNVFPRSFVKDRTVDVPVGAETLQTAELMPKTNTKMRNKQEVLLDI